MRHTKMLGWIVALTVFGTPRDAAAYCVDERDLLLFWSSDFPGLRIPIWVGISPEHSVEFTGQTPQDIARLAIEVIARHNESVGVPKLYFAGFTTKEYNPTLPDTMMVTAAAELPAGITLLSTTTCQEMEEVCGDVAACANFSNRGPYLMDPSTHDDPLGWVVLSPPDCGVVDYSMTSYGDLAQVMLHEIGHTLGLNHSNRTKIVCEAGDNVHNGPTEGTVGVMNTALPASFAAYRSWRRDDLEGLGYLYGAAAGAFEIAWWEDANYPDYPADSSGTSLVDMPVSRAAVVSNRAPSGFVALVTTAPNGRVVHRLMNEAGGLSPDITDVVVDPGSQGITWAAPAVAMSGEPLDERVFVVWMADELQDSNKLTLRAAVRPAGALSWQYSDHPDPFTVNRLAAGYDPGSGVFVVTTLNAATAQLEIVLFDIDGVSLGPAITIEGLQAFGIGGPLCDGARCLVPFSESAFGGPDFGVAEVMLDPRTPAAALLSIEVLESANTYGMLSLVGDGPELLAGTGERRFFLGAHPGLMSDGVEQHYNPNTDWALGIGMWGGLNPTSTRLFQPRPVVCGNGIVQASEECDDANAVPGDGCDACTVVNDPGTDSDSEATGGSLDDGTNGCECRTEGTGRAWPGFFSMFGILIVARRVGLRGREVPSGARADRALCSFVEPSPTDR